MSPMPLQAPIDRLIAAEQEIVAQPDEFRVRLVRRVNASVPRTRHLRAVPSAGVLAHHGKRAASAPRWALGRTATALLVLSALCLAAFYAGYWVRNPGQGAWFTGPPSEGTKAARLTS